MVPEAILELKVLPEMMPMLRKRIDAAEAALAKPPRNCDLYATRKEAWLAWENHCEETGTYEDVDEIDLYNEWLFSKAKGVDDGK